MEGASYWYRLSLIAQDGSRIASQRVQVTVEELRWRTALYATYEVRYSIGVAVRLEVFDVAGKRVRVLELGARTPGEYRVAWDRLADSGRSVSSGVYVVRLVAGDATVARKIALVK